MSLSGKGVAGYLILVWGWRGCSDEGCLISLIKVECATGVVGCEWYRLGV